MNKILSIIIKIILPVMCMQISSACTKDNIETDLSKYVGSYSIESIYWTGEPIDINGDGIGERDMLSEFKGIAGFIKEWIKGSVKEIAANTLSFNSIVPVYLTNTLSKKSNMEYYDADILAIWREDWGHPNFDTETYKPVIENSVIGARRAVLYNINSNSYELHVECSLYEEFKGEINGTMIFTFVK